MDLDFETCFVKASKIVGAVLLSAIRTTDYQLLNLKTLSSKRELIHASTL
jgi:hypothetical protein